MDVGKMGKNGPWTWVPSMPPLLSSDLKVSGLKIKNFRHCAFTRKKFKKVKNWVRKITRGKLGQWLYTKNLQFTQMLQRALRMADTPAEPQTGLRW